MRHFLNFKQFYKNKHKNIQKKSIKLPEIPTDIEEKVK